MSVENINDLLNRIVQESDPDKIWDLKKEAGKLSRPGIKSLCEVLKNEPTEMREAAIISIEGIANNLSMIDLEGVILLALDPLIIGLEDDSPRVRQAAVSALGRILHQYYINTKQLNMLNPNLRELICKIFNPLVSMLDDKSIDVRLSTASIILDYSGSENIDGFVWGDKDSADLARKILIAGLENDSAEVRIYAGEKLRYDADENVRKRAEEMLKDNSVIEPLLQDLKNEDREVRNKAAMALGYKGDKRAVEALIQALEDEVEIVRSGAALHLGNIGDKRAIESLIKAMEDEVDDVKWNATLALGKMGEQRAVEPLIQALNDKNQFIREIATTAIGKTGDERVVESLIQTLNDEYEDVRMGAARALGESKDKRAVESLIQALKDKESCVRWEAATALGEIKDTRALEPLTQALKDEHEDVRNNAKEALEKIRANSN
jgi:HEAT repeat protein